MDDNEILSRLDARGRAAAAGTHHAVADIPVPPFDAEVVVVPLAERGTGRRWLAIGGVAAALVLLVGLVGLFAARDDEGDPVVDTGSVRRFVADQVPEGLVPSFLSSVPTSPGGGSAELYGPTPTDPRAAVGIEPEEVAPGIDFEPEGRPDWDEATFGSRDGFVMSDPDLGWYGVAVVVGGEEVMVLGEEEDRAALERIAATVEVAEGAVVADSPELPDGWSGQGRVADLFGASSMSMYGGGAGETIGYLAVDEAEDPQVLRSVTVSTVAGGPPEVAAIAALPWPDKDRSDITVRGRPAVLVHVAAWTPARSISEGAWIVSWMERPGEVVRVSASGVSREDLLAVADGVRPAEDGEWERLERESLGNPPRARPGEVVLGEGTFTDGSPWLLVVHPDGGHGSTSSEVGAGGPTMDASTDAVGGPIPSDVELVESDPSPGIEVRTTADSSTGMSSASSGTTASTGGEVPYDPFPHGLSTDAGGSRAWSYALVADDVATVELVAADGEALASTEVLSAGGFRGFVLEVPPGLLSWGGEEPSSDPETAPSSVARSSPATSEVSQTTALALGGSDPPADRPQLVARAADGTELGRQSLP